MVETKEISELTRSNRIAMLSHISTVTVMVFFMIWESVKRTTVSGIYDNRYGCWCHTFDWRGDLLESNTEHAMIKHLVSYGFSLFYTICLFYLTDKSDLCICNSDDFCCHHLQ